MEIAKNYFPENLTISADSKIKVYNLESINGSPVKNQYVIHFCGADEIRFQSYDTTVIYYDWLCKILTIFPEAFGYSKTTSRYSKLFLISECGLTEEEAEEVKKIAKSESFGRDCPLYIQL